MTPDQSKLLESYWRLKAAMKQPGDVNRVLVMKLLKAIAVLIGDEDWPDLSAFDKLFIDEERL